MNPYEMALACQDAVNLSGVVKDWARQLDAVWAEARSKGEGTRYVNEHPTSKLIADKVASLAGIQGVTSHTMDTYRDAAQACRDHLDRRPEGCDRCGWTTSSATPHSTVCPGTLRKLDMEAGAPRP
jgi:hypothetical protein